MQRINIRLGKQRATMDQGYKGDKKRNKLHIWRFRPAIWVYFLCATILWSARTDWGFFGHEHINRLAVFTLPPDMARFYKRHIDYIVKASVDPDRRRRAVKAEAARHYIDLDVYEPAGAPPAPLYYEEAKKRWGNAFLEAEGIVPWYIYTMYWRLREAFLLRNSERILRISAEMGHYVADAHVPLHTTKNYDGQFTGQWGIHSLWESRLPELFFDRYSFWVGKASYIDSVQTYAWAAVRQAHQAVDSVLNMEKRLQSRWGDRKYTFEQRGKRTVKVVAEQYAERYHHMLNGMVGRQMRAAVKAVGSLWYTAWVDAGQPALDSLIDYQPDAKTLENRTRELSEWRKGEFQARPHEGSND